MTATKQLYLYWNLIANRWSQQLDDFCRQFVALYIAHSTRLNVSEYTCMIVFRFMFVKHESNNVFALHFKIRTTLWWSTTYNSSQHIRVCECNVTKCKKRFKGFRCSCNFYGSFIEKIETKMCQMRKIKVKTELKELKVLASVQI